MANYNSSATVTLTVNGQQAQQMLAKLQKEASQLEVRIRKASAAGDKATMKKLQKELTSTNRLINQLTNNTKSVEAVMARLDKASPKQLQKTLKVLQLELEKIERGSSAWNKQQARIRAVKDELQKLNAQSLSLKELERTMRRLDTASPKQLNRALQTLTMQLQNIKRGTAAWDAQIAKIKAVKAELAKLNTQMAITEKEGFWSKIARKANDWGTAIFGAIAMFSGFVMAGRKAVKAFADMEESMANTRKYTRMTIEDVAELNEGFKRMNTRLAREELNLLAQEAGRLGKNTKESVQGYVEAAQIINVALVDLGEGATQTIAKISNIFGIEEMYGVKDAMLKVGSTVNHLSQICTATKPFIVEFTQRMAGIGSTAKMTVPEIMAFASTLDANGQKVEMSASALSRLIMKLFQDPVAVAKQLGMEVDQFVNTLNRNSTKGIIMFLDRLHELGGDKAIAVLSPLFKDLGMDGVRMAQVLANLSAHLDMLKDQMNEANTAFREGKSAVNEFNIFNNTAQAKIDKAKNKFHEMTVELGEKLYPVMGKIYTTSSMMIRILNIIVTFIANHAKVIGTVTTAIVSYYVAVGVAKVATLAWRGVCLLCTQSLNALKYAAGLTEVVITLFTKGLTAAKTEFAALNAVMKANPFGLIVSIVATLVVMFKNLKEEVDEYNKTVDDALAKANGFEEAAMKEQRELDILFVKLQGAEKGTDDYNKAKNSIIQQYGQYLNGLIDEKGEIIDLTAAYNRLAQAVRRAAQERGIAAAEQEINDAWYRESASLLNELQQQLEAYGASTLDASRIAQTVATAMGAGKPIPQSVINEINTYSAGRPALGFWDDINYTLRNTDPNSLWGFHRWVNSGIASILPGDASSVLDNSPADVVNRMYDRMETRDQALANLEAMHDGFNPMRKVSNTELQWSIETLQRVVDSGQGGAALIHENGNVFSYVDVTLDKARELLEQYQEELALRGGNNTRTRTEGGGGGGYTPPGDGDKDKNKGKQPDRFEAEKQYKAMREAYALINYSRGYREDQQGNIHAYTAYDYQLEKDRIDVAYYQKILEREDLTWLERLEMQSKYQEAMRKLQEDFNAHSIDIENDTHRRKVIAIRQQYADGILNEEQYNQALEDEDMRHLGVVRDIYQQQSHANHAMWEQQRRDATEAMKMFNGNVDLTHRPQISAQKLTDAGWEGAGGPNDIATVYSSQYGIVDDQGTTREILVTPILPDGSVLSESELEDYIHNVLEGSSDILAADTKGIVIAVDVDPDGSAGETLHQLQEQFYSLEPPTTDWDIYNQKYLPANDEYLNRANSIQTRKTREAQQEQDAYDQQYQKTWDFMMPDDKNKRDYDEEMHWLNEVYNHEMELAVDNEERKLQLTQAYNIAKIALAKKYGQEQHAAFVEAINKSAEWLNSDGGKALTQSMSTLANGMSQILSQVTAMMQADLEIQTNEINKRYDAEISRAEGNSYQVRKLEEQKQKEIAKAKNEANRKMFAMQVIQAVAQTATNAINAYGSAAAIPVVGFVMAPIAAAMAIAAGMLQIAAIKKQQQASESQGYAEGGFTPDGGKYEPVGIVHGGEWVASQKLTKNPQVRPLLEMLDYAQRTNTVGSLTSDAVSAMMPSTAGTTQSAIRQTSTPVINIEAPEVSTQQPIDPALASAITRLTDRLDEPFVTVNTVSGDHGIQKAQSDYDRLMRNKTPKSKK